MDCQRRTHGVLPKRAVRSIGHDLGGMTEVAAREASSNLGVVLAARDDGEVEALEVLGELSADTQRSGEGLEVEAVLLLEGELVS